MQVAVRDALAAQERLRGEHASGETHGGPRAGLAARQAEHGERVDVRFAGDGQSGAPGVGERRDRGSVHPYLCDAGRVQRGDDLRRTMAPGIRPRISHERTSAGMPGESDGDVRRDSAAGHPCDGGAAAPVRRRGGRLGVRRSHAI